MEIIKFNGVDVALNAYAEHVHSLNRKWWYDEAGNKIESTFHLPTRFNLLQSEIFEGFEAFRKSAKDDHLPQYPGLWAEMADVVIRVLDSAHAFGWNIRPAPIDQWFIPTNISEHLFILSDEANLLAHVALELDEGWNITAGNVVYAIIARATQIAVAEGCEDFWQVVYDKLVYNWSRADHSYAARAAEGGKKF